MTHPTLGYANFRFAGDDRTHMPATSTATMTVACDATGPADETLPHDVDAAVDCPDCLHALGSDEWMAYLEQERRTGETTSLQGTLDDVRDAAQRLMSQADAVMDETMLGGGAAMSQKRLNGINETMRRAAQENAHLYAYKLMPPTPMKGIATGNADDMLAMAHQLEAADEVLARGFAASPLADLRRYEVSTHSLGGIARPGPWTGEAPLLDPGAERVRKAIEAARHEVELAGDGYEPPLGEPLADSVHAAIEAAQQTLTEHPFGEATPGDGEAGTTSYVATPEAHRQMAAAMYPHLSGGRNWCHVHNRPAMVDSELCVECDYSEPADDEASS